MVSIAGALVSFGNRAGLTIGVYSIIKQAGSDEPGEKKKKLIVATTSWPYARFYKCGPWPGHVHRFVPPVMHLSFFNQRINYLDAVK